MDQNQVPRKSDRSNKGIPPIRFGFEDYGLKRNAAIQDQEKDGACGGESFTQTDETLIRGKNNTISNPNYAKSIASSKANTKISRQSSVREVEYLKKTLEREAEIHKIEMLKLEKEKEFLLKTQKLELELKRQEDELSNNFDEEDQFH